MLGKLNFNLLTLYIALCKYDCNCQVFVLFLFSFSRFYFQVTELLFTLENFLHQHLHTFKRVVCKIYFSFLMSRVGGVAVSFFSQNWGGVSTSQLHLKFLKI